ncbi:hypothetical protein Hanom_Chr16g01439081 [Helianthus anomalus]
MRIPFDFGSSGDEHSRYWIRIKVVDFIVDREMQTCLRILKIVTRFPRWRFRYVLVG